MNDKNVPIEDKRRKIKMRIIVIDIGGTEIKSGVFMNGSLTQIKNHPTDAKRGATEVLNTVGTIIEYYKAADAIGICTTGQINVEKGRVSFAGPNIPDYQGFEIKKILEKRFCIPVLVENDVNAAALGEAHFGAGVGVNDFLCLTYGTGIGGAIILNGQLVRGIDYAAGEFGGIIVHPEDRNENDIFSGCYERYASVSALVNAAKKVDASLQNGRDICDRMNEEAVRKVINNWIQEISIGQITLINIFNPEQIIVGGGIMEQDALVSEIKKNVKERIMESYKAVKICKTKLGNFAGLYGMGYLAGKKLCEHDMEDDKMNSKC